MQIWIKIWVFAACLACASVSNAQINLPKLAGEDLKENITVKTLQHDSLSSSFLIVIKNRVPLHKHLHHAEHVYVIEGSGNMVLGNQQFKINAGDYVFIPKNTPHAVQVHEGQILKVISIQSPYFDGSDRINLE